MTTDDFEAARELFFTGVKLQEAGRHAEAEAAYVGSLARLPGRASTLVNLGVVRLALDRPQEALVPIDEALGAEPASADAWSYRGIACAALGRDEEAANAFERALALAPAQPGLRFQHALALHGSGRHADARAALETLLHDAPDHAAAWMLHGQTLQSLDRHAEAIGSYERAIAIDPSLAAAWTHLGLLQKDLGRPAAAAASFERALASGDDDDAVPRYCLAALRRVDAPPQSPPGYVRALFDSYAQDFEDHLVETLHYRAHEAVVHAAAVCGRGPYRDALDLGCGTGLCGTLLRPSVVRLTGVDLSPTMLRLAAARGVYDTLVEADVAAHLASTDERCDLVVAADVFIYIGALDAVFAGVRRVLRPAGVFAFSVEAGADDAPYELRECLRYAHGERALRTLAQAHGFAVIGLARETLREEQGRPIAGLVMCLGAPA